jgi:hypothetical protein
MEISVGIQKNNSIHRNGKGIARVRFCSLGSTGCQPVVVGGLPTTAQRNAGTWAMNVR